MNKKTNNTVRIIIKAPDDKYQGHVTPKSKLPPPPPRKKIK